MGGCRDSGCDTQHACLVTRCACHGATSAVGAHLARVLFRNTSVTAFRRPPTARSDRSPRSSTRQQWKGPPTPLTHELGTQLASANVFASHRRNHSQRDRHDRATDHLEYNSTDNTRLHDDKGTRDRAGYELPHARRAAHGNASWPHLRSLSHTCPTASPRWTSPTDTNECQPSPKGVWHTQPGATEDRGRHRARPAYPAADVSRRHAILCRLCPASSADGTAPGTLDASLARGGRITPGPGCSGSRAVSSSTYAIGASGPVLAHPPHLRGRSMM